MALKTLLFSFLPSPKNGAGVPNQSCGIFSHKLVSNQAKNHDFSILAPSIGNNHIKHARKFQIKLPNSNSNSLVSAKNSHQALN